MAQEADYQNRKKVIEMLLKAKPNNIQTLEIFCSSNNKMIKTTLYMVKDHTIKMRRGLKRSSNFTLFLLMLMN